MPAMKEKFHKTSSQEEKYQTHNHQNQSSNWAPEPSLPLGVSIYGENAEEGSKDVERGKECPEAREESSKGNHPLSGGKQGIKIEACALSALPQKEPYQEAKEINNPSAYQIFIHKEDKPFFKRCHGEKD